MHKQLTEQERKNSAAKSFAVNPKEEKYFVTPDGQCFSSEQVAMQHGGVVTGSISDKNVMSVSRGDVGEEIESELAEIKERNEKSAIKARVAAIRSTSTLDELMALEIGNDEPKQVQDALDKQLKKFDK